METRSGRHAYWIATEAVAPPMSDHHFIHRDSPMAVPPPLSVGWGAIVATLLLDRLLPALARRLNSFARHQGGAVDAWAALGPIGVRGEQPAGICDGNMQQTGTFDAASEQP